MHRLTAALGALALLLTLGACGGATTQPQAPGRAGAHTGATAAATAGESDLAHLLLDPVELPRPATAPALDDAC